jgi:hypothetical protein
MNSIRETGMVDIKIGNKASWEKVKMVVEKGTIQYSNTKNVNYYSVTMDRVISLRADVSSTT